MQRGFTLIEFVVVLVIGSLITLTGLLAANQVIQTGKVKTAKARAAQVMDATHAFYESTCGLGSEPVPTVSLLISKGFLDSTEDAVNPLGGNFMPSIAWGDQSTSSRIRVSSVLSVDYSAASYRANLGADRSSGQTLIWDEAPRLSSRHVGLDILAHMYLHEPGSCR